MGKQRQRGGRGERVDKEGIKTAIRDELGRRVAMSGGPEVFRRLVRGDASLVEGALQELVQEGLLTETRLRVGKIYHYPANTATRLDILAGFMKKMAEAPARPPRPAPRAAAPATRDPGAPPIRDPAAPRPARPDITETVAADLPTATPAAPAKGEKGAWVPKRATPRDPNKPRPVPRSPVAPAGPSTDAEGPHETPSDAKEPDHG
jgi:hypothetical protein